MDWTRARDCTPTTDSDELERGRNERGREGRRASVAVPVPLTPLQSTQSQALLPAWKRSLASMPSGCKFSRSSSAIKPYFVNCNRPSTLNRIARTPIPSSLKTVRHGSVLSLRLCLCPISSLTSSPLPSPCTRHVSHRGPSARLRNSQVSPVPPGTSVRTRVPSAPTTARRENSSSVVSPPTPSSAQSASTPSVSAVATSSTVPFVSTRVTLPGAASMSPGRPVSLVS